MFAVVAINGKQYKVTPGQLVSVENYDGKVGDNVSFESALFTDENGKMHIGTPTVKGVLVKAKIIKYTKEGKIDVRRFKSKVRVRRGTGFRAQKTLLEIASVG